MKDGGLFILAVFVQSIYSVCIQIKLIENALLSCYDDWTQTLWTLLNDFISK